MSDLDDALAAMNGSDAPPSAANAPSAQPDLDSALDAMNNPDPPGGQPTPPVVRRYQQPAPKPTAPPADWFMQGVKNLPSSTLKQASSLYEAVRHPIDSGSLAAVQGIGKGIESKIAQEAGQKYDPNDQAVVNALMQSYKDRYHSLDAVKSAWANDSAGVLMDATAVMGGGELALGRAGATIGALGDVASRVGAKGIGDAISATGSAVSGAGKVAGKTAQVINPLNPGGIFTAGINKVAGVNIKMTPAIRNYLEREHGITPTDFAALPDDAKKTFMSTLQQKGVTPAAIDDAISRTAGTDPTLQSVSRTKAPDFSRAEVGEQTASNNATLADQATSALGAPAPLGQTFEKSYVNSLNNAGAGYDTIRNTDARLSAPMALPDVQTALNARLQAAGKPTLSALLTNKANLAAYPQASYIAGKLAIPTLTKGLNTTGSGVTDAAEFMHIRQLMNDAANDAVGGDAAASRAIISGYHDAIGTAGTKGLIQDASGAPVPGLSQAMKDTNDAYAQHFRTFNAPDVKPATNMLRKQLQPTGGGMLQPTGDPAVHEALEGAMTRQLLNPTRGNQTYGALSAALGPDASVLDQHLQQMALANNGQALTPVKNVPEMLNDSGSVMGKAFASNPSGLSQAKFLHATNKINNRSKGLAPSKHGIAGALAQKALLAGTVGLVGHHVAGFPGMLMAEAAEPSLERLINKTRVAKQLSGAPNRRMWLANLAKAGVSPTASIIGRGIQQASYLNQPVSSVAAAPASGAGPRNVRNNNPGNIIDSTFAKGQPGYRGSDGEMAIFDTPEHGYEAAHNLLTHYAATGRDTISKIIDSWAPASDKRNSPSDRAEYKKYLAGRLGISPDQPITASLIEPLTHAIAHFEGDKTAATGGRITRASGGRAEPSEDELFQRLWNSAKVAKKAEDNSTKPLLHVPDENIVKALSVAQEAI